MSFFNKFRSEKNQLNFEQEILDHIHCLLSTKRLFEAVQRDYGLGDIVYGSKSSNFVKKIALQVAAVLKKYEPRLIIDSVEPVESSNIFQISILLKCQIHETKRSLLLSFQNQKELLELEVQP
ncbi:MAG: GPW/gp25 family protein [Candidatus Algichlamydia australiensis]|nr:GPW/gp25 family protein [Chlamydiales bacterium]